MTDATIPRIKIMQRRGFGQLVHVILCANCGEELSAMPQPLTQRMPRAMAREMEGDYWAHKPSCAGAAARAASSAT